jgi:hypothetical protein
MYFFDHDPPHFHASHSGNEARVGIEPVALLDGNLSARSLALVVEWARLHQAELMDNWWRLRADEPPQRIPPLE